MPDFEALLAEQPDLELMDEQSPIAPDIRTKLDVLGEQVHARGMAALRI